MDADISVPEDAGSEPAVASAAGVVALAVDSLSDADPQAVAIGERYWTFDGVDDTVDPPRPRWREKSSALSAAAGVGNGRVYLVAAAGVRAVVPTLQCPTCDGPLSLRSRLNFEKLLAGRQAVPCIDCDAGVLDAVNREANPAAIERRRAVQVKERRRGVLVDARTAWQAAQVAHLSQELEVRLDPDPDWSKVTASVGTEVAALAVIRHAPKVTPIPPLSGWAVPLGATPDRGNELVLDCFDADLLLIHPGSPVSAFTWNTTFEAAAAAEELPAPAWEQFYPAYVSWYVPTGPSLGTAAEQLDAHLLRRLRLSTVSRRRREEFLDLVVEVIAEETLRYFRFQLERHNLPNVAANHDARLSDAARRLAGVRSLAETYNTAWTMVRAAAATAQAKPSAPKANMTAHAVNLFEAKAQELAADLDLVVKPFNEDSAVPLSAMTRTVFLTLLDSSMLGTSRAAAEAILDAQAAETEIQDELDVGFTEMMRTVLRTGTEGDPHAVYAALGRESANSDPVIAAAATKLIDMIEDLRIATRGLHTALAGAVSACRLLTVRVTVPDLWWGGTAPVKQPVGVYLAELMRQEAERQQPD
ncbi:hypothetical protein ACFO1B_21125 [Dactylosporangium siamense]|uniref:Uncharacterized protein n=1 Tax=Dactylosporangium siamense TaxID=685454 RepID=A0A919PMW5_9ACTN|nr:hypothetical protein [Dactylosporangium siamense]GIG46759.1 hypothetical protein Dsi01nite_048000 [Dactylosporangium siamense]